MGGIGEERARACRGRSPQYDGSICASDKASVYSSITAGDSYSLNYM